jgi:hypothetical protein
VGGALGHINNGEMREGVVAAVGRCYIPVYWEVVCEKAVALAEDGLRMVEPRTNLQRL